MPSIRYRSIEEITETLRNAKSRGRGCTLLIGAGCSVKAGIPTAAGFIDIIRHEYERAYSRAPEKTYAKCMGELLLSERRDLIARYVDRALINWAHLCMALLVQEGYVDRVLTTNFDLLVVRACAVLGRFPAIYDFATSQLLKTADIPGEAVFYLHGQRTGFVLMNTVEDMEKHATLLGPVFEDAGSGRVWIVVGYSGENDPVFDHLARIARFDNGLFWIGYGDNEPQAHVRERLLGRDKDAFFTNGFDADSFFIRLTQALKIFPPDLVARPFTYLEHALTRIAPFTAPGQASEDDVLRTSRRWIHNAIAQFEKPAWEIITEGSTARVEGQERSGMIAVAAQFLLMAGHHEQVLAFAKDYEESPSAELANVLSMAYVMRGNQLLDQAKTKTGREAESLFSEAGKQYEAALAINPSRYEALQNWGNMLLDLAKTKTRNDADRVLIEAQHKYEAALDLKEDCALLISLGNLLLERAKAAVGGDVDELFAAAAEKYQRAVAINPHTPHVFQNWGNLLLDQAKTKTGEEADRLFQAAEANYRTAIDIKPQMYEAYCQWGNVLLDQAKTKMGKDADQLFAAAEEKYRAALAIRGDSWDAFTNWGNLLLDWGKTRSGQEARVLFTAAQDKYQAALAFKPGASDVLHNWRNLLQDWRRMEDTDEGSHLLAEAEQKYEAALSSPP